MKTTVSIGQHASVTKDMTGLNNLLAGIDEHLVVRIGILGNKPHAKARMAALEELKKKGGHKISRTKESDDSNADIGLKMERGSKSEKIPPRSWLKTPLEDHLPEYFNKVTYKVIEDIVKTQNLKGYQELAVACEQIIQKGFNTGGYGKWAGNRPLTIQLKGSSRPLIDTGQLRKSVTSEIRSV